MERQPVTGHDKYQIEFESVTRDQYDREQVNKQFRSVLMDARDCGFSEAELIALVKEPH